MNWLEFSRLLLIAIPVLLFFLALALFLYDSLRFLARDIRWRAAKRKGSPEAEAVDAIAHYQGDFSLSKPSGVRQRFAHHYEVEVRGHWNCGGKWVPDQ